MQLKRWEDMLKKGPIKARLVSIYDRAEMHDKAGRMRACGAALERVICSTDQEHHIEAGYRVRCHQRFCPVCSAQVAKYQAHQMIETIKHIQADKKDHVWVMLCLTVRNCDVGDFAATYQAMMDACGRMQDWVWWKRYVLGGVKRMEVTYNRETHQFHPHIHMLLQMDKSYFVSGYKDKLEWAEMWRKAMRIDYLPNVYVRRVDKNRSVVSASTVVDAVDEEEARLIRIADAGLETVAKYVTKVCGMMNNVPFIRQVEVLRALEDVMARRRTLIYFGSLYKAHKELGFDDAETMEDVVNDGICPICGMPLVREVYYLSAGHYYLGHTATELQLTG